MQQVKAAAMDVYFGMRFYDHDARDDEETFIANLRFNDTLPNLLNNIEAIAKPERHGSSVVPAVKVSAFHFSSVTDSI